MPLVDITNAYEKKKHQLGGKHRSFIGYDVRGRLFFSDKGCTGSRPLLANYNIHCRRVTLDCGGC